MSIFQIIFLIFTQTLVSAAPSLLSHFPNTTYGITPGNISNTFPISNTSRNLDPIINSTASPNLNGNELPKFPTAGNWTSITCDVIDGPQFIGSIAWTNSSASDAWTQLIASWNMPDREIYGSGIFPEYAWGVFHFTTKPSCLLEGDSPDCSDPPTCGYPPISPAGTLILDSIVYLFWMFRDQDNALNEAYLSMNAQMVNLAATFAPTEADTDNAKKILDIIDTVLGFVSAGSLSTMFKEIQVLEHVTEKQIETIKNVVEAGISIASTALDNIPTPQTDEDEGDVLGSILSQYYDKLRQAQKSTLTTLLNITDAKSQQTLTSLVQTGYVLNLENGSINKSTDVSELTEQMLWGKMIPAAWAISSTPQIPFILRVDKSDHTCNTSFADDSTLATFMSEDTASNTLWCDPEGNSFFLLRANFDKNCGRSICLEDNSYAFEKLSGGDSQTLNGNPDQFGGITLGDMIGSSWLGFIQNGKKNGYELPDASSLTITDELPFVAGIKTPGFFNFNICLDPHEALHNIVNGEKNSPIICGTIPQVAGSTADVNAPGQFTPGLCRVHVVQFQRNEGNENLLNSYQLQVTIVDNAGLPVGSATKQNAAEPLILVDTVLPYSLIVAAQGPDDSSTVNFWYSDQWWTSNDQAHHCNFGAYDSGYRQGDCDFNCPIPSGEPPASATITQPVPSGAVAAVGGTATFSNSYTTPASTPADTTTAPIAPPTPTYATGWCGMHVEQYQKHEGAENPTGNFELEVTIFDAKQKPIGTSGIVQAPAGQPISVAGLISPLQVTTSALDNDPLTFSFNGHQWTSHDCSVGEYDSGNRNMDCGFSC